MNYLHQTLFHQTSNHHILYQKKIISNNPEQQKNILKNLVDRMWDYTHKNIFMDTLISQGYTQEMMEAVSNLYHIIYNLNSTGRKNLKNEIQDITTENMPYETEKYSNTIAIMKALIKGKLFQ
jgi:hypothetical protein